VGGVIVMSANRTSPAAAKRCTRPVDESDQAPLQGFLVQEMIAHGAELILGFHRDPQLGPAVLLGFGGITAELFQRPRRFACRRWAGRMPRR